MLRTGWFKEITHSLRLWVLLTFQKKWLHKLVQMIWN